MSDLGNKATMAENIKYYMELNNKTRNDMCEALGLKYTTLTDWVNGKKYPRIDKIEMMANYFGIEKSDLVEKRNPLPKASNIIPLPKTKKVPLLGMIACGEPILAVENIESYVDMDSDIHADFALKCKGDSMINARIFNGDIVYIREQPTVENGEIAAVLIDGATDEAEATLKRFYRENNKITLCAANPMYEDLVFREENMNRVRVVGKAVAFLSAVR